MSYVASSLDKRCGTCVYWGGSRKIDHLIRRVTHDGGSGVCIKRESPKFNNTATYGNTCKYFLSILK